jgi:hypothetical protein
MSNTTNTTNSSKGEIEILRFAQKDMWEIGAANHFLFLKNKIWGTNPAILRLLQT